MIPAPFEHRISISTKYYVCVPQDSNVAFNIFCSHNNFISPYVVGLISEVNVATIVPSEFSCLGSQVGISKDRPLPKNIINLS